MTEGSEFDSWSAGRDYERFMGRWSRRLATEFVAWLEAPAGADWVDVGCGTGALTAAVLGGGAPRSVLALDPSEDFVGLARSQVADPRVRFERGEAARLPAAGESADVVVSGLVLNFVPDRPAALAEMQRVLRPGGMVAFYVWDYPGGGMEPIDAFWKAAAEVDGAAGALDEAVRFGFCTRDGLAALGAAAGLRALVVEPIAIETVFASFEEFWHPFTLGAGPAPGYCRSLQPEVRAALRARLAARFGGMEPIRMTARAWAVRGRRGG